MIKYASAPDEENLKKLIAEFYYSTAESVILAADGAIIKNGKKLSTKWKKQGKRYIFYSERF